MLAGSAARFLATAQALTDDDLYQASALPGSTRARVLTHVAQAADSHRPSGGAAGLAVWSQ
jgi:maleylpyruvate isomerase